MSHPSDFLAYMLNARFQPHLDDLTKSKGYALLSISAPNLTADFALFARFIPELHYICKK